MASSNGNGMNVGKCVITGWAFFLTMALSACSSRSDLQEVTRKAVVATTAAQSYRETGTTSQTSGGDTVTLYAEGEYAAPDRYRVKVRKDTGSWHECIQIGDQSYVLTADDADWPGGERGESCVVLPIAEELEVLSHLVDFEVLPDQQIGGVDCVHYRANVDVEALAAKWEAEAEYPPPPEVLNLMKGQSMGVELWVGKDDYLVRQMKTEARLPEYDLVTGQERWVTQNTTARFYDFNEPIAIEPPTSTPSGAATTRPLESPAILPEEARPMTLAEARETLAAYAQKWQPGAEIAFLCSVDDAEESPSSGVDGRRRAWHAVLMGTSPPGAKLSVLLLDASIIEETTLPPDPDQPTLTGRLALDSPEALTLALAAKPGFTPALPSGKGVHFCLERRQGGSLAINVRGARGPYPAFVSLDATTGDVLGGQFQTFGWGGILYSSDGGQTWDGVALPGFPQITADPLMEDKAYAATTQDSRIAVYDTQDGGATWTPVGTLPDDAGHWPFALEAIAATSQETHLLVGTWSGLWSSADGREWSLVPGLPEGPKQWLAAVQSETGYRLFVSITAGDDRGLYASTDLMNWKKLDDDAYRLSESFDHEMVLATYGQRPDGALLLSIDAEAEVDMPEPVLGAAGDFTGSAPMIINGHRSGVGRRFGQAVDWTGPAVGVGTVTAAPDFPTSGLAILGGFRSGIYRTTDGGQTWHQVVANPSMVVPGNNEIGAVEFLSPTAVIAVNGAPLTWQDF